MNGFVMPVRLTRRNPGFSGTNQIGFNRIESSCRICFEYYVVYGPWLLSVLLLDSGA